MIYVTVRDNGVSDYGLPPIVLVDMTDDLFTGIDISTVNDHEVRVAVINLTTMASSGLDASPTGRNSISKFTKGSKVRVEQHDTVASDSVKCTSDLIERLCNYG